MTKESGYRSIDPRPHFITEGLETWETGVIIIVVTFFREAVGTLGDLHHLGDQGLEEKRASDIFVRSFAFVFVCVQAINVYNGQRHCV